jgi:ankyrin repeat protein
MPPISFAIMGNRDKQLEIVEILAQHEKTDLESLDEKGRTPLAIALEESQYHISNREEIQQVLIRAGAKLNGLGFERPALVSAAFSSTSKTVDLMIEKKADVNIQDRYGITAIMAAAISNKLDVIEVLLSANARPDIPDHQRGISVNEFLSKKTLSTESKNVLRRLIKVSKKLNTPDRYGLTPLFYALINDHDDMIPLLLDAGADANYRGPKMELSPLHAAVVRAKPKAVRELLAHQAEVNDKTNYEKMTPLDLIRKKQQKWAFFDAGPSENLPEIERILIAAGGN